MLAGGDDGDEEAVNPAVPLVYVIHPFLSWVLWNELNAFLLAS